MLCSSITIGVHGEAIGIDGATTPTCTTDLAIANSHHVAAAALERAQHKLVVTHDVAHHHVVEAHLPVAAEILDDGLPASHE